MPRPLAVLVLAAMAVPGCRRPVATDSRRRPAAAAVKPVRAAGRGGKPRRADSQAALFDAPGTGWEAIDGPGRERIRALAGDTAAALDRAKTPRRAVASLVGLYRASGATPLEDNAGPLPPGSRAYYVAPGGDAALFILTGKSGAATGVRGVVAAIDGPRIDLKQRPAYQHGSTASFETQLYGETSLEAWLARPLALYVHALAAPARRGARPAPPIDFAVGEDAGDPVLAIPDLPPHLSRRLKARQAVDTPERLDPIAAASIAALDTALRARGIAIAGLVDAEAVLVPAGAAFTVGVDRALLAGYAAGNLALAYLSVRALAAAAPADATLAVILMSKSQTEGTGTSGRAFVGRALARTLSSAGGDTDLLARRRASARSVLLLAGAVDQEPGHAIWISPRSDDASPGALRTLLDRLTAAGVSTDVASSGFRPARELGALDVDVVGYGVAARGLGGPIEVVSTLALDRALTGLAAWFSP